MDLNKFEQTLIPGEVCNVRRNPHRDGKLMRKVISVKRLKREDKNWLYWYWEPQDGNDLGNTSGKDCGYSGVQIE